VPNELCAGSVCHGRTPPSIASYLSSREVGHPLRVGIDGVCGAGKTTFANELAVAVQATGRPTIRLDSDGFHHVAAVRRKGADPARGYYDNAYDFFSLVERVLLPLGAGGDLVYAPKIHDLVSDELVTASAVASVQAVVIFDCTFLQRGALRQHWDEVVYLEVPVSVAKSRGIARDKDGLGGVERTAELYDTRYMAACEIYLREESPGHKATIVIDHGDPSCPVLMRGPDLEPLSKS